MLVHMDPSKLDSHVDLRTQILGTTPHQLWLCVDIVKSPYWVQQRRWVTSPGQLFSIERDGLMEGYA